MDLLTPPDAGMIRKGVEDALGRREPDESLKPLATGNVRPVSKRVATNAVDPEDRSTSG